MDHLDLDQIQRFLRARLPENEQAAIVRHLRSCEDCFRAVEDERRFSNLLALDILPDVEVDVQQLVNKVSRRKRGRRLPWVLAAIALFVAAGSGGFVTGRWMTNAQIRIDTSPIPGVPVDLEAEVAANMDAVRLIRSNYELVRDVAMLRTFHQLLEERPEGL
ncbi:MAG: anti-sigma factor [Phycisphaerae bacterium]